MRFRKDINGLRAIAVLLVVLYHFSIPGFQGGFVGVDIFFVISGFLMTQIIFARTDEKRFSLLEFYLARARRIVPALLVLVATLVLAGWFLLPPPEYKVLGRHSVGALTFLSNFLFYREAGYFDQTAHEKWLLHTWSLSVEWQFYLIYPVLVVALSRLFARPGIRIALFAFAASSLALCILITPHHSTAAFYLLPTRTWEMLIGGLIYLFPLIANDEWKRKIAQYTGLAAILASALLMNSRTSWPGWHALLPVLGAALTIWSACQRSRVLDNRFAQWCGTTSYSAYLWHWPVVVGLVYFEHFDEIEYRIAGIALSLVLGSLSYYLVERTTHDLGRTKNPERLPRIAWLLALSRIGATALPVAILALVVWRSDGYPYRVSGAVRTLEVETASDRSLRRDCFDTGDITRPCLLGGKRDKVSLILLGDSQALALAPAVRQAMPAEFDGALYFRAHSGCGTVIDGDNPDDEGCLKFNRTYLPQMLSERFAGVPIVIVNMWQGAFTSAKFAFADQRRGNVVPFSPNEYRRRAIDTVCRIAERHPTVIVGPLPDWEHDVAPILARRLMLQSKAPDVTQSIEHHLALHRDAIALMGDFQRDCKVTVLDPLRYLCSNGRCLGTEAGHPLYYDRRHLNDNGSMKLVPMFSNAFHVLQKEAAIH